MALLLWTRSRTLHFVLPVFLPWVVQLHVIMYQLEMATVLHSVRHCVKLNCVYLNFIAHHAGKFCTKWCAGNASHIPLLPVCVY